MHLDSARSENTEPALPDWNDIPGSSRLQDWACQLGDACAPGSGESAPWDLIGHAIMVVGPDTAACAAALRRAAVEASIGFLDISGLDVLDLPAATELRRKAPLIVHLGSDPGLVDPEHVDNEEQLEILNTFRANLIGSIRDFDPARPVIIATTAIEVTDIALDLREVGLFDRYFRLPAPTMEAYGRDFVERIGAANCGESILHALPKVGMLFSSTYDNERRKSLALLRLRRLMAHANQPLEFADLVTLTLNGFAEEDTRPVKSPAVLRQTAYHEAGHAVVAVIDSEGQNMPEYASIVPSAGFDGIVVSSLDYSQMHNTGETYADMRHDVRISLAGRAAEELIAGPEAVTNGAASDLRNAVLHSAAGFAYWGFAPAMEKESQACSNLMIIGIDDDEFSPSEQVRLESLVREFLATEYESVKRMLTEHRTLLDAVADRLIRDAVVDQATLIDLARLHLQAA